MFPSLPSKVTSMRYLMHSGRLSSQCAVVCQNRLRKCRWQSTCPRDFPTREPKNHREGATTLGVCEEAVVGVLQHVHGLVHDVLVEEGVQD
jgi:hypothetical protein